MAVDSRGWQVGRSILDCHKYMLEKHVACDVTFLFPTPDGSTTRVPAHSYMLRCRSPVFEAMLSGNFKEKDEDISITDIEPEVFKEVLRYMYYDEAGLSCHNVLHVLFAAKKYLLEELVSRCQRFLTEEMCADNVCTILSHCLRYDETELIEECVKFMKGNASLVIQSEDFMELNKEALCMLLGKDDFGVQKEIDLLRACIKWAEAQKKTGTMRDVLGKALYQIRFHALSTEDLLDSHEKHADLLTNDEVLWFVHRLIKKGESESIGVDMSRFNLKSRNSQFRIASRFKEVSSQARWSYSCCHPDRICFQCSEKVWFKGISVFGGEETGDKHEVNLKLLKNSQILSTSKSCITSDGTSSPIEVLVTKPVYLEPDGLYTIEADFRGPPTYSGRQGQSKVTMNSFVVTYSDYHGQSNCTSIDSGQISEIILYR